MSRVRLLALLTLPLALTAVAAEAVSASNEHFTATISQGVCSAGQVCTLNATVQAREGQRIHKPFVITKELDKSTPELRVTPGRSSDTMGTATLTFTPAKAGKVPFRLEVSACVSADANCLMEKVELALDVDVK